MRQHAAILWTLSLAVATTAACRPSDVLSVPAPAGVFANTALRNQSGAEGALDGGKVQLFGQIGGDYFTRLLGWSEMMTDELRFELSNGSAGANMDARMTTGGGGFFEQGDLPWKGLLQARAELLAAEGGLARYEPPSGQSMIGEAYALAGYAELFLAESYCAGTPLDGVREDGSIQYGTPLTTDSLLGVAEAHFDSAVAQAHGDPTVMGLASVGLGRALLGRGQFQAAGAAAGSVPASFVYNIELEPDRKSGTAQGPSLYARAFASSVFRTFNVSDREGQNGLNFVSAHDPRLVLDSSMTTADGTWYFPLKFEMNLSAIPLATGIEAQLIVAEAALQAHNVPGWLATLNALRNSGCTVPGVDSTCALGTGQVLGQRTGVASLADPGTDSGRVSLQFRERAFWLFGTGTRLGDLRRLIRQYGRDQSVVFPSGPYAGGNNPSFPHPIPSYGTDVSITLPTAAGVTPFVGLIALPTNPSYKGCISPTTTG